MAFLTISSSVGVFGLVYPSRTRGLLSDSETGNTLTLVEVQTHRSRQTRCLLQAQRLARRVRDVPRRFEARPAEDYVYALTDGWTARTRCRLAEA
jgi:hypothetical protein